MRLHLIDTLRRAHECCCQAQEDTGGAILLIILIIALGLALSLLIFTY